MSAGRVVPVAAHDTAEFRKWFDVEYLGVIVNTVGGDLYGDEA